MTMIAENPRDFIPQSWIEFANTNDDAIAVSDVTTNIIGNTPNPDVLELELIVTFMEDGREVKERGRVTPQ